MAIHVSRGISKSSGCLLLFAIPFAAIGIGMAGVLGYTIWNAGRMQEWVEVPVAVGFGISTPEQAAAVATVADGVVVGSALLKVLGAEGPEAAGRWLAELRAAMDEATAG